MMILILVLLGSVWFTATHMNSSEQVITTSHLQTKIRAMLADLCPASSPTFFYGKLTATCLNKKITAINTTTPVAEINDFYIFRSWQVKDNNREHLFLTLNTPVEINST